MHICQPIFTMLSIGWLALSPALAQAGNMIRDSELETGLKTLSNELAQAAGFHEGVEIRIIIDPDYNAFVSGGQTIYLHSGLLLQARSAEEILGVIAHELGHLAAGHVPRRSESLKEASLASSLAAVAAAAAAISGGSTDLALGLAIGGADRAERAYLKRSRNDEAVADEWALQLLDKTNISVRGLSELMRRLSSQRGLPANRQSAYYSSHPGAFERLATFSDHLRQTGTNKQLDDATLKHLSRLTIKLAAYVYAPDVTLASGFIPPWTLSAQNRDQVTPPPAALTYAKAIAYYRRGELTQAQQVIKKLITAYPQDIWFHEFAGDIYLSAGKPKQAANYYQNALKLKPKNAQISLNLGRALISTGQADDIKHAITALEQAQIGEPEWGFVKRQLAIAYGRDGQLGRADILLAEEAMMRDDKKNAARLARRALTQKNTPDDVESKAQDILFQLGMPVETE